MVRDDAAGPDIAQLSPRQRGLTRAPVARCDGGAAAHSDAEHWIHGDPTQRMPRWIDFDLSAYETRGGFRELGRVDVAGTERAYAPNDHAIITLVPLQDRSGADAEPPAHRFR